MGKLSKDGVMAVTAWAGAKIAPAIMPAATAKAEQVITSTVRGVKEAMTKTGSIGEPVLATPAGATVKVASGKTPLQKMSDPLEMAMTLEQAAKVSKLKQERFLKEAERKLDEGLSEAKASGKLDKLPNDQQGWLKADSTGRRERLAFDPDVKRFKVEEAKVALQAEKDGVVLNPVRRAINETGSSGGGDYIGADGKYWDVKSAGGGANKIVDSANPDIARSKGAENVLVDCSGMSKAEIQALKAEVDGKLQSGSGAVHYIVPQP
jgi:hypothetical protein